MQTEIIPAVDVLDGGVVRLLRGSYEDVTNYDGHPAATVARWHDLGAPLVHVVDLAGARRGTADAALWEAIGSTRASFQAGGGLRTPADAQIAVAAGASRVVLGTTAVHGGELLTGVVEAVGAERVVAALDVRDGHAVGGGWEEEGRSLDAVISGIERAGVIRALVTGIARDGTMVGPDLGLLSRVQEAAPRLAVIASGGVGTLDDIAAVAATGVEGVIVGRALYEGRFTFQEAVAAAL